MATVRLSKAAQKDLVSIRRYIRKELNNPQAAVRIIAGLKNSILSLQIFPERGRPLDAVISVHTEYRYLVWEHYCIFYLPSEEGSIVIRILHQRQDFMRALFSDER